MTVRGTWLVAGFALVVPPLALASTPRSLHAQVAPAAGNIPWVTPDSTRWTERGPGGMHIVAGERAGVSFFPKFRHAEVEYEAGDVLTFDRYHTVDVMYTWVQRWAKQYPQLIDLYEVGKSFEGRPILQVTLTNKAKGSHLDKPAAFFEGGRHSGEISGSESTLWLLQHLLTNYGTDARITQLLDTKTIYLRVQNNPDGSNLYLQTAQRNRSSVRPHDSDGDGLKDEDAEEDLDGDGIIYTMRWRPKADPAGGAPICWSVSDGRGGQRHQRANARQDARDPSGRLLRGAPADSADWCTATEGVDNDLDGRFNEDGIGGLDLHRNYLENWRPEPGQERTRRGNTQGGAGEYPLSEPETRAVVLWLLKHPHVSVVNSMDTRVPMHLRPPSTSAPEERMYPEDLRYYTYFDTVGQRLTHYQWAGDVYKTYNTRTPINPFTGEPTKPEPLFGHGPDFGYFYFGSIWYGDEIWNGGAYEDYNKDGLFDDADALVWDGRVNGGRGFKPWTPMTHPQLGAVEIGGFHPKFFGQNSPPSVLEEWAKNQGLFNLEMAFHLPQIEVAEPVIRKVNSAGDSTVWRITAKVTNSGRLPTALRQAQLVKIVTPDRADLEFATALTTGAAPTVRIVTPTTRSKSVEFGHLEPKESKTVTFEVRVKGATPITGTLKVQSTRGGVVSVPVKLGQ